MVEADARREVVGDRRHVAAPERSTGQEPEPDADPDESELRRIRVTVRLTVEAVARHVPATVRVAVLDLMGDLERLDAEAAELADGSEGTDRTDGIEGGRDGETR
jgi:hypothetical protein